MHDDRVGYLTGRGHQVLGQGPRKEAAVAGIAELFHQRRAQPLGECASDLAIGQRRVQERAGVVSGDVSVHPHAAGVRVDLQATDVEHEAVGG